MNSTKPFWWTLGAMLALLLSTSALQAQEKEAEETANPAAAEAPAETAPAKPVVTDELAAEQSQVADKYSRLEELMFKMADFEATSNPRRAALLKQAYKQSKDQLTRTQLDQVVALLNERKLKQAVDGQKEAESDMASLLELLLSENRSDRLKREQDRIRDYIKEIERLQRLQKSTRGRTEGGADPERLAEEQQKVADRTGDLADKLKELGGGQGEAGDGKSDGENEGESKGDSEGESKGDSEGDSKGDSEGESKGDKEGDSKGKSEGDSKGKSEGDSKGDSEGESKGDSEGESKGDKEGDSKGKSEGDSKGKSEGDSKGDSEGESKGDKEGNSKGDKEGNSKGKSEGDSKGDSEGDSKGDSEGDSKGDSKGGKQDSKQSDNPTQQRVKAAQERMQQAQRRLEEAKRKEAIEEQIKAEEELAKAKAELEEILRQLREEELGRMLALLEERFAKMLQMQLKVYEGTRRLSQIPQAERDREVDVRAGKLSFEERKIAVEADRALTLLLEEGSSIAFPEAVDQMREDMEQVVERLAETKVDRITQGIEEDIIQALEEMVAALQKAQQDLEDGESGPSGPPGNPADKPLVDQIAELKMIRALQMRVNTRTKRYARLLDDEDDPVGQARDEDLRSALDRLGDREEKIQDVTRDIVLGKNK